MTGAVRSIGFGEAEHSWFGNGLAEQTVFVAPKVGASEVGVLGWDGDRWFQGGLHKKIVQAAT